MAARSKKVDGALYPATPEGFTKMLDEANNMVERGYQLLTVVRLDKAIAVVYVEAPETRPGANLVD